MLPINPYKCNQALDTFQDTLRESLAKDGLSSALAMLKKALPEQTEKYNLVFQLETRLNRINKDRIKGILSQEQLEIAYNRLSDDILNLVANLNTEDFEVPSAAAAAGGRKTGALALPNSTQDGIGSGKSLSLYCAPGL